MLHRRATSRSVMDHAVGGGPPLPDASAIAKRTASPRPEKPKVARTASSRASSSLVSRTEMVDFTARLPMLYCYQCKTRAQQNKKKRPGRLPPGRGETLAAENADFPPAPGQPISMTLL